MRNKIWLLCLSAALLLVMLLAFSASDETQALSLFSLQLSVDGGTETVRCYKSEDEQYFVFLPGFAELSAAKIRLHTGEPLEINGLTLTEGMNCSSRFDVNQPYPFSVGKNLHTITFLRASALPSMHIDTRSGEMDYIHAKKGNSEDASIRVFTADGTQNYRAENASIQGRGNNTWDSFEKKPYSITLEVDSDLLGLGAAQRWVLLANADDRSHLRNKIVYDFAAELGLPYSPQSAWVDVYLNGEYAGLYLLSERNEVHPQRVSLSQEAVLVSMEREDRLVAQNYPHFVTKAKQAMRIHFPNSMSEMELKQIAALWQNAENAILAENGIDPVTQKHWTELIDLDSWARKYLLEEVFGNGDGCYISQYFYYDAAGTTGKIHAGPAWDYDHTMGAENAWALSLPNTMYANRYHVKDGFDTPWFHALYQKDEFYDRVVELYKTEYLPKLNSIFETEIYEYADQITQSVDLDEIRWGNERRGVQFYARRIADYMQERLVFLRSVWLEDIEYHTVMADHSFGGMHGYFMIPHGQTFEEMPQFEDIQTHTFVGWFNAETDKPFDASKPITGDVSIYAKWEEKPQESHKDILKLAPAAVLAVAFLAMLVIEGRNMKKRRGR